MKDSIGSDALAVADPASPTYGQHLTAAEVARRSAADPAAVAMVTQWLAGAGLVVRTQAIGGDVSVLTAEVRPIRCWFSLSWVLSHL